MPAKKVAEIPADVIATVQKVWQAGLGAFTLAQDEGAKVISTLVSVGEQIEVRVLRVDPDERKIGLAFVHKLGGAPAAETPPAEAPAPEPEAPPADATPSA